MDSAVKIIAASADHQLERAALCSRIYEDVEGILERSGLQSRFQEAKISLEKAWSKHSVKRDESWTAEANRRLRQTVFASHGSKRHDFLDKHGTKRRRLLDENSDENDMLSTERYMEFFPAAEPFSSEILKNATQFVDFEYLAHLERFGFVHGLPHTNTRLQQAEQLFNTPLRLQYGRMNRDKWMKFLLEQPSDYYVAACLESSDDLETMPQQKMCWLRDNMPEGTNASMLKELASRRNIIQTISETMMTDQARWLQDSHKRGQKLISHVPNVAELNGSRIHINQHGLITIKYCQHGGKTTIQIKLGASFVPLNYLDLRTLHFTDGGMDIRNGQGQIIRGSCSTKAATIPVGTFAQYGNGREIIDLWHQITGLPHPEQSFLSMETPAASPQGQSIPSKMPTELPYPPPTENDALWLLKEFLDEKLPMGGEFWTGSRDLYPQRSTEATGTDDFLR